jgi:hypothetical protein
VPRFPPLRHRLDKLTLDRLYTRSGLNTVQIAQRYGTQASSVAELMAEYGIEARPRALRKF